ncbi:MAG: type II toxin-antitoxin system RelE/ParE family toxin [Candidatus Kapaibacterium sp.]|nr:MAG: type II toxin-antitoxin system RelE/ParE family toxin [Candidatus Kapabacteria bacterium]
MYKIEYTKRFLKDLASLPNDVQSQIESIVFEELPKHNIFSLGYLEKMHGYKDKYKIRVGMYRIGITIYTSERTVVVERAAHRREIYRFFP